MSPFTVDRLVRGPDELARSYRRLVSLHLLREPIHGVDQRAVLGKCLDVVVRSNGVVREAELALLSLQPIAPWWDPGARWEVSPDNKVLIPIPQALRVGLAGDVDPVVVVEPQAQVYAGIPLETFEGVLADGYGS